MKRLLFTFLAFVLLGAVWKVQPVSAGTDIAVSCDLTTCTATPNSIPLFNEANIWPGYSVTQQITATNTTGENGQLGILANEVINRDQEIQLSALAGRIYIEIHQGSANGPVVYGGSNTTLQDFYNAGQVELGFIDPTKTDLYFLKTTFDPQADNELMGTDTRFNLEVGFEFTPIPAPGNPQVQGLTVPTGGGDPNGADTPTCGDTPPSSAPVLLSATGNGGQVALNWTAVAGADHYAVNFGIQPGFYLYGNNNVGNVTTYVVSGLSPGNRYFFQILGINGCAPGPRSNERSTQGTLLPPGTQIGVPTGFSPQQVLGASTEASNEATPSGKTPTDGVPGVLGAQEECVPWKPFLPFVFMVIQFVVSVVIYMLFRDPESKLKQVGVVIAVIVSTVLFYFLRKCDCSQQTLLAWLCQWYFVIAIVEALITQFINYELIEREE